MITLSNNTKGLALLQQVEEIYGKVYTSDSLLETVLYWGINCTIAVTLHLLLKTGKMKIGRINLKVWILTICGIVSLNIIMKVLKNMYQNIFPKKDVNPNLNG